MNSVMLANRLTGKLSVKNLPALVAEDATTVLDAMTAGIKEWFDALPPTRKQTPFTETIRASFLATLAVTDGSKAYTIVSPASFPSNGYASASELLGKAVLFADAGPLNRIASPTALLKPYFGPTGSAFAGIFCDSVGFSSREIRVVDAPIWEGESSGRWELIPNTEANRFPTVRWGSAGRRPEYGPPRFYHTEPLNPTTGNTTSWIMRLWPIPMERGTVTFTLETIPPAMTLDALQVPVDIPIPDEDMPDVIALCEARLTGTPLWSDKADKTKADAAAERTRSILARKWVPLDAAPARIPTPSNW